MTAVVMIVAGVGGLFLAAGSAQADVTSVAGRAYAAKVSTSLGINVGPIPAGTDNTGVHGSASASGPTTYDTGTQTGVPINIPGVISVGLLDGASQGNALAANRHLGFSASITHVGNIVIGPGSINITAITASCASNGDGSVGSVSLVGATANGQPLVTSPTANEPPIVIAGIATIALNEQAVTNVPGSSTSITVNAVHITLLPSILGGSNLADIVLGHVECSAAGPDVLVPPTTSSTIAASTTSTSAATTSTTVASTTSTTTAATTSTTTASTTSTTAATTTTSTSSTTSTTLPQEVLTIPTTTPVVTVAGTTLARTGADLQPLAVLSALSIVLGILLLIGSGRPLTAAGATGTPGVAGGTMIDGSPERWGPVEIGKTIGAGAMALVMGLAKLFGPRGHKRE